MQKALITPSKPKPVSVSIPGSKSYTNRALVIAALADGKSILKNPLFSDDTKYTIEALKKLGIKILKNDDDDLEVFGTGGKFNDPKETLFLGNAGTGIRFLTALLCITGFKSKITGDERMQERPIKDLLVGLKQLGAKIDTAKKNSCPPVKVSGNGLKGGTIEISGKVSSQYLSALLMISPYAYAEKDVTISIKDKLVSKPYIDMTLQIMKDFGIKVENKKYGQFIIKSDQKYHPQEYLIEGDASSASYFFALSALHQTPIKIKNISTKSLQADIGFLNVFKKMGCKVSENSSSIQINAPKELKSLGKIDLNHMPDAAMTVAVVSAFTKGKTQLVNIENLRVKETDRIFALVKELKKLGVDAKELKDGIEINGNPEKIKGDALIETYNDHRMAMCFSVLVTKIKNIQILDPDCTSKTYPTFFNDLKKIGINVKLEKIPNIYLTGMRGSGKSSIGKKIAKKLHRNLIDSDDEIKKQEKMEIPQIIKKKNWFYFRKKEKYVIRKISKLKNTVISTGGGIILDKENVKSLKKNGKIVFLNCKLNVLEKRIQKSSFHRPPLTKQKTLNEELSELWKKREQKYKDSADLIIDVSDNTALEEKAEKIIMNL